MLVANGRGIARAVRQLAVTALTPVPATRQPPHAEQIKILSALAGAEDRAGDQRLRDNVIGLREIVRSGSHKANNFKGSIYMVRGRGWRAGGTFEVWAGGSRSFTQAAASPSSLCCAPTCPTHPAAAAAARCSTTWTTT